MTQTEFNEMYNRTVSMWEGAYYEKLADLCNNAQAMRKVFNKVKLVSHRTMLDFADALCYLIRANKLGL